MLSISAIPLEGTTGYLPALKGVQKPNTFMKKQHEAHYFFQMGNCGVDRRFGGSMFQEQQFQPLLLEFEQHGYHKIE